MSSLNPLEQEMALSLANRIQNDLEEFRVKMQRHHFNTQFSGVFNQQLDGSISLVKPKPFIKENLR